MGMRSSKRFLTLAVMAVLLSGVNNAQAAPTDPPNATATVTGSNNTSTTTNRYSSIIVSSDADNELYAIESAGDVYVTDGATIKATGTGENISGSDKDVNAYGLHYIYDPTAGVVVHTTTINGNVSIIVTATGGTATNAGASAEAHGLHTDGRSGRLTTINGNARITAIATGGTTTGGGAYSYASAHAYGLSAYNDGKNTVTGDAIIKTEATVQQSGQAFSACSLYANNSDSVNNLSSLGTLKQLEGDVYAWGSGTNNLVMDTAASYLQGNLLQNPYSNGTNNITISKGATWRPVYDNRYGSYFDEYNADTYVKTYAVDDIATTANDVLNLSDGGIIDLTWETPLASRNSNFRALTLEKFSGTNGIFRINTDLANNKADKITLNAADSGSTVKIQVNYDPYFATNPNVGESITGAAGVLKGTAASTITVTGAESEYNAYKFTPTIAWNSTSNQWELKALTTSAYIPPIPLNQL